MKATKGKRTTKPYRTHHEATVESFRRDPKFAAAYLNAVLEDGDRAEIMTALRYVTDGFGGVAGVGGLLLEVRPQADSTSTWALIAVGALLPQGVASVASVWVWWFRAEF